jgi:type IV secretion system protein VirD4
MSETYEEMYQHWKRDEEARQDGQNVPHRYPKDFEEQFAYRLGGEQYTDKMWWHENMGIVMWPLMIVVAFLILRSMWRAGRKMEKREAERKAHLATVHGTAEWQSHESMIANKLMGKEAAGLILGRSGATDELIRINDDGHILTFAPTGAGKGVSAITPNLLTYPGSVVVIDPKGENAAICARRRREMGQEVHIFAPFGTTDENHVSAAFNPLDWLDPDGDEASEDAALLADALAPADLRQSDQFWNNEARAMLAGLLLFIATHEPPERRNLGRLRDLLSLHPDEWRGLLEQMRESPNELVRGAGNRISQKADKEASGVLSTAQMHTHFLESRKIRAVMDRSTVDLGQVKKAPVSLFLVLPAEQLQNHARWLRLMISMLLRGVARDKVSKPEHDVLFMLDEFAALGPLLMVKQAFGLMRGYRLKMWAILQDLPQLQGLYRDDWQTFIANTVAIQAFSVNDRATAEYISKQLGQETVETGSNTYNQQGTTQSASLTGRPLKMPDELLRIDKSDEILLLRAMLPVWCARVIYWQDKRFIPLADPNPYVQNKPKK